MSFTGGGLKLKGGPVAGVKKKQKKKKESKEALLAASESADGGTPDAPDAVDIDKAPKPSGKTEAQRKHDEYVAKRQKELLKKTALKSHRDRVQEYNEALASLSEHHDIPKVGPG